MQELNEVENTVLGTAAAFVECLALQPTLYWKNAAQQGLPFTVKPSVIYRGLGAALFSEMGQMGLQFGLTGLMQRVIMGKDLGFRKMTTSEEIGAALLGGSVAAFYTSPVELVMIQQQRYGGSLASVPGGILRTHGFSHGLMRGLTPTMARDGIYVGGLLGLTPAIQDVLVQRYGMSTTVAGAGASAVGGVVAGVLSCPFDAAKTCMQGDLARAQYPGFSGTLSLMANRGIGSLFGGVFWRTVNITLTILIANECCNRLGPIMFAEKFADRRDTE